MSGFLVYSLDETRRGRAGRGVLRGLARALAFAPVTHLGGPDGLKSQVLLHVHRLSSSSSSSGECFLTSALAFGHLHCRPGSFLARFVAGFLRRRILETTRVFYTKPTKNATKLILFWPASRILSGPRVYKIQLKISTLQAFAIRGWERERRASRAPRARLRERWRRARLRER